MTTESLEDTIPNAWTPVVPAAQPVAPKESADFAAASSQSSEVPPPLMPVVDIQPAPVSISEPALPSNAPDIPRVSLELPPESDLVLVETSHMRVVTEAEEPEMPRRGRVRAPRAEVLDEPLEMVETTRKDSIPPAE